MNAQERKDFLAHLKRVALDSERFGRDEIKYILTIAEALIIFRHKYAVDAAAARQGFEFGINAAARCVNIDEALAFLETLIQ